MSTLTRVDFRSLEAHIAGGPRGGRYDDEGPADARRQGPHRDRGGRWSARPHASRGAAPSSADAVWSGVATRTGAASGWAWQVKPRRAMARTTSLAVKSR